MLAVNQLRAQDEISALRGGSYLDRLYSRLAAGFAFVQQGAAIGAPGRPPQPPAS